MNGDTRSIQSEERWVLALLSLARELWVVKDRQQLLEAALAARGALPAEELDRHQPGKEEQDRIDLECRAFVERIVAEIMPRKAS
jgi:hypothetical protein